MEVNHLKNSGPEKPLRGMYDYPIWYIKDFDLPDVKLQIKELEQGHELRHNLGLGQNTLKEINAFEDAWVSNVEKILDVVKSSNLLVLDQMWVGKIKNLQAGKNIKLYCDKPGLFMGEHIDNRWVVGVLIINLKDNSTGTYINELDYEGPRQKGTGIFMLNNYNTSHSIRVPFADQEDRHIGYQTFSYEDFKND